MTDIQTKIENNGPYPEYLKEMIIQLIRALFSDSTIIRDSDLQDYTWSSDRTSNNILIGAVERFDLEETELRPAVLVKRIQSKFIDIAQKDNLIRSEGSGASKVEYREFRAITSFEIRCIGKSSLESELIASEVSVRLKEISLPICDDYSLKKFKIGGMGGSEYQKETGDWVVTVLCQISAHHSSKIAISNLPGRLGDIDW